jgi:hypothetical protein
MYFGTVVLPCNQMGAAGQWLPGKLAPFYSVRENNPRWFNVSMKIAERRILAALF